MTNFLRRWATPFAYATACIVAAFAAKAALHPTVSMSERPYTLLAGAIALAAWFGRTTGGVMAIVLASAAMYLALPRLGLSPPYNAGEDNAHLGVFLVEGLVIAVLIGRLRAITSQQAAHQLLSQSQMRVLSHTVDELQRVLASAPVGIVVGHGAEGQDLSVNPTAAAMLGVQGTKSGLIGSGTSPLVPLTDQGAVCSTQGAMRDAAIREAPVRREIVDMVQADGTAVSLLETASPLFDREGKVCGSVGVLVDVSGKGASTREATLAPGEESPPPSPCAVVSMDTSGLVVEWDAAAEKLFGFSRSEALARPLASLIIPAEYREMQRRGLATYLATGKAPVLDRRVNSIALHKDGHRFPVELSIRAVQQDGDALFTARVREAKSPPRDAARSNRQELEVRLLHQAIALATETDSFEDAIRSCLDLVCRLLDWPVGHAFVPDKHGARLVSTRQWHLDHPERYIELVRGKEQGGLAPGQGLAGRVWASDVPMWIEDIQAEEEFDTFHLFRKSPLHSAFAVPVKVQGKTEAILEFFTEEIRPGDLKTLYLVRSVGEQVGRVIERRRAMEELSRAKDEAESANRQKSAFLANVSHELRTPMNAITGMTHVALADDIPAHVRDYLQTVKDSADSLLRLLNDLLDCSRIEAGTFTVDSHPFRIRPLLEKTIKMHGPRAEEKGLALRSVVDDAVPDAFLGDPMRIQQVLHNLLSNAIKFTQRGQVTTRVTVETSHDATVGLRFSVEDTGEGIPPDQKDRVFARFGQGALGLAQRREGVGLGLAIASQIVAAMGGRLDYESQLKQGTTFWFTIGLGRTASLPVEERGAGIDDASSLGRPLRVLVAEDIPANHKVLAAMLSRMRCSIETVTNGRQAVEAAAASSFDVILMDIEMPLMDGLEATRAIRAREAPERPRIPIVAMTAYAMPDDRARCLAAGMDHYLTKPIEPDELARVLSRIASRPSDSPRAAVDGQGARPTSAPRESSSDEYCVIDLPAAMRRLMDNEDLVRTVAQHIVEDTPPLLERLHEGLAQNDAQAVESAAHRIKGLVSNFSAGASTQSANQIELLARQGDLPAAAQAVRELEQAWVRMQRDLRKLLNKTRPPETCPGGSPQGRVEG